MVSSGGWGEGVGCVCGWVEYELANRGRTGRVARKSFCFFQIFFKFFIKAVRTRKSGGFSSYGVVGNTRCGPRGGLEELLKNVFNFSIRRGLFVKK